MNLPKLEIPFQLPFEVPVGLHSPVVHFAIAIPVIIILLEFFNIFFKKRSLSVFSLFLTLLLATVMIGAYYTGVSDGQEAYDALINAGKEELKEHKELGIILVYASLALVVFKLFFMLFKGAVSKILFLLITMLFTALTFKQGHDGGELVYEYGANNKALEKALEINSDLKDELEECKEEQADTQDQTQTAKEEPKEEQKSEATQETQEEDKPETKAEDTQQKDSTEDANEEEKKEADTKEAEDSTTSDNNDSNNS